MAVLSPSTQLALMRSTATAPAVAPPLSDDPRDCVRSFPTLNPNVTELVGFDLDGKARLKIVLPTEDVSDEWERWIMRYVRRKYSRRLRVIR